MAPRPKLAPLSILFLVIGVAVAAEQPGKRFLSRWKPDKEGWIVLFGGKSLDGWQGDRRTWRILKGQLRGYGDKGTAFLRAREADWADYCLALKVMLGTDGTAVVSHGTLAVELASKSVRLGYPKKGWKTLGRKAKGLGRKKWYDIELDTRGKHAEVRINGKVALVSDEHEPLAGGPAIEALHGGVAFGAIRLRLHESDPDYRAVVLGEGYTDDPNTREVVAPDEPPPPTALGRGDHLLFNGRGLKGWERSGTWSIANGEMTGRAPRGKMACAYVPATDTHRDYVLRARCRILRTSKQARADEYFVLLFRQQVPGNFLCIRFPIEGIFEIGGYYKARFQEITRGVRKGRYNKWREIEITIRGDQINLRVDRLGGLPTWKFKGFTRGAVGVGVTGGEAAFKDIRVRILR